MVRGCALKANICASLLNEGLAGKEKQAPGVDKNFISV